MDELWMWACALVTFVAGAVLVSIPFLGFAALVKYLFY